MIKAFGADAHPATDHYLTGLCLDGASGSDP